MDNKLRALYVVKPHGLISTITGEPINYVITIYEKILACNFMVYYVSTTIYFPCTGEQEQDERMFLRQNKDLLTRYLKKIRNIMGPHHIDVLDLRKAKVGENQYEDVVDAWNKTTK